MWSMIPWLINGDDILVVSLILGNSLYDCVIFYQLIQTSIYHFLGRKSTLKFKAIFSMQVLFTKTKRYHSITFSDLTFPDNHSVKKKKKQKSPASVNILRQCHQHPPNTGQWTSNTFKLKWNIPKAINKQWPNYLCRKFPLFYLMESIK